MKFVLAPDSFKGSMTASDAAEAMAAGIRRVLPDAELVVIPLADGGEGTLDVVLRASGGIPVAVTVAGPFGTPVEAAYGLLDNGRTAVVEMALAAGLTLVPPHLRDPRSTTTYGVGELILDACAAGAQRVVVGLGGSGTNDGGAGALQALGVLFYDRVGKQLATHVTGIDLHRLARIDVEHMKVPRSVQIVIASDVTNPLLGPLGATAVYGPQKGATAQICAELEEALANYAAVLKMDLGVDVGGCVSGGAAGGLGAGLIALFNAEVRSGIDLIMDLLHFDERITGTDFIFTGEGKLDHQTVHGKAVSGILARCRAAGVPLIAFGGEVEPDADEALVAAGLLAAVPMASGPMALEDALVNGKQLLDAASARVTRLLSYR